MKRKLLSLEERIKRDRRHRELLAKRESEVAADVEWLAKNRGGEDYESCMRLYQAVLCQVVDDATLGVLSHEGRQNRSPEYRGYQRQALAFLSSNRDGLRVLCERTDKTPRDVLSAVARIVGAQA